MNPENETRRNTNSLASTPCSDYPYSTESLPSINADSLSINSSLVSSTVDCLSTSSVDQESPFSAESRSVLQEENGSETFSVLQSPESAAAVTPEENGSAPELLNLSNDKNRVGTSAAMDSLTSSDPLLLTEDKVDNNGPERNWSHLSELTEEANPSQQPHDQVGCSAQCETEGTFALSNLQSTLESLEQTQPVDGISLNTKTAEESFGWDTGIETLTDWKQQPLLDTVPKNLMGCHPALSKEEACPPQSALLEQDHREAFQVQYSTNSANECISNGCDARPEKSASSDEEDIYGHSLPYSSSEASVAEMGGCLVPQDKVQTSVGEGALLKSDQVRCPSYPAPAHVHTRFIASFKQSILLELVFLKLIFSWYAWGHCWKLC